MIHELASSFEFFPKMWGVGFSGKKCHGFDKIRKAM